MNEAARADKWLWAVRLFKTRRLAADMCAAGKIKRRGHVVKASTALHAGDLLEVPFAEGPGVRSIEVVRLIEKRVSALEAGECHLETTADDVRDVQKRWHQARLKGVRGRPTKRERRDMDRIRGFLE